MTTEREQIAWLYRRVGFGLSPGELDERVDQGVDRALDALVDPDASGVPPAPDPWVDLDLVPPPDATRSPSQLRQAAGAWVAAMAATPRPLSEWVRWFWHGHLVSSIAELPAVVLMVEQLRTYGRVGLTDASTLLRAATVDPAMLLYLNGNESRRGGVNENYGRELLELFALGIGHYDERDVRAASVALSGWVVDRAWRQGVARASFVPARHDPTPQTLLGVAGVTDVESVVAAVVAHPACAPFLTGALATAVLGPEVDAGLVRRLARDANGDGGVAFRPLVRSLLEAGLDGAGSPLVAAPVPWLARVVRATQVPATQYLAAAGDWLQLAGQVPLRPPNVGGWPGGAAWLSSSTTVARTNLAIKMARMAPEDSVALDAAARGDLADLADLLGVPEGFGRATREAVRLAGSGGDPTLALAAAAISPEVVVS